VEQALDVLQDHFAIVRYPIFTWSQEKIWVVMHACAIMHNLIIDSERDDPATRNDHLNAN
jgi:predicted phosphoadenosine phosphosulfate sulfurtransferase